MVSKPEANSSRADSARSTPKSPRRGRRPALIEGDHGADGPAAGMVAPASIVIGSVGSKTDPEGMVREIHERVNRRAGAPLIERLDRPRREAAATYAATFEIVEAGGVKGEGGERVGGGAPAREGRQFQALRWSEELRRLEAAVGGGVVRLDARGRSIEVIRLLRMVVVGGLSLVRVLTSIGIKRTAARENAMKQAVEAALSRMAVVLGYEKSEIV